MWLSLPLIPFHFSDNNEFGKKSQKRKKCWVFLHQRECEHVLLIPIMITYDAWWGVLPSFWSVGSIMSFDSMWVVKLTFLPSLHNLACIPPLLIHQTILCGHLLIQSKALCLWLGFFTIWLTVFVGRLWSWILGYVLKPWAWAQFGSWLLWLWCSLHLLI